MKREVAGLTQSEAEKRLLEFGPNVLPEKPPPNSLKIFMSQLKSPLVYVLLVAGVITLFLHDYTDTFIIFLAVVINTLLGFIQEKRASQALDALKKMLHPTVLTIRDGVRVQMAIENLVPGDLVILPQGEKVPADGVLIEATHIYLEEALLTGESSPVIKSPHDEVFMGTIVTAGRGLMEVVTTGSKTKMGEIALSVQEATEETPLKRQLKHFSKLLSIFVVLLTTLVFILGTFGGKELTEIFTTSVALSVSAIPEGLLVSLTVILAIGMQRILAKKGLVRNLVSAETLGGVTTICVDKTGTLTLGRMELESTIGDEKLLAKQAILSNDQDDPLTIAAWQWAEAKLTAKDLKGERIDAYIKKHKRLDTLPFSSENRFSATLHRWRGDSNVIFVNGAPDFLLEWCTISRSEKEIWMKEVEKLTSQGKRLIGMARKEVPSEKTSLVNKNAMEKLKFVGILAFSDPVRQGVEEALNLAKAAGIRQVVITGDYPQTAISVMKKLGMETGEVFVGEELNRMSEAELSSLLQKRMTVLFARTTPAQKLKIVMALKKNGEVVAMTGDGVNDAPALSRADIGIAVAEASEVSKESADLVLLDSSFNTIIEAVEEGRGIFDNIRKVVLYLLSDAFSEIVAVLGAIFLALPLPITATQILWINLVSDGFPNLALTIDPKRKNAMFEPPRNPKERLVNKWMMSLIAMVSVFSGISALFLFVFIWKTTGDLILARSVSFAALGVNSLVYVFSVRGLKEPVWKVNPLGNIWLIAGVLGGAVLQILPFMTQFGHRLFGVVGIPFIYWIYIASLTFVMLILIEVSKVFIRR